MEKKIVQPITINFKLLKWKDYVKSDGPTAIIGALLLFFFMVCLLGLTVCYAVDAKDTQEFIKSTIMGGIFAVVGVVLLCNFLSLYIKRNVFGNNLWFYRIPDIAPNHREIIAEVAPRGKTLHVVDCAIVIPLGGWFNKQPRVWFGPKAQFVDNDHCWRIDDFRPCDSYTIEHSCVAIKNRHNETIQLEIDQTLDLFNHFLAHEQMNEPPVYPIGHKLFTSIRDLFEAKQNLEICIGALHATAGAILDTKRFGKSKDAARIRTDILDTLKQVLPPGDPRLPKDDSPSNAA